MQQPLPYGPDRYQDAHLTVNFERQTAYLDGAPLRLTFKSFVLLAFLVRHPGELVPRYLLLAEVWGYTPEIRTRTLDVHIRRLRRSFGHYGHAYIETIFGIGYRFQPWRPARLETTAAAITPRALIEPKVSWKMAASPA